MSRRSCFAHTPSLNVTEGRSAGRITYPPCGLIVQVLTPVGIHEKLSHGHDTICKSYSKSHKCLTALDIGGSGYNPSQTVIAVRYASVALHIGVWKVPKLSPTNADPIRAHRHPPKVPDQFSTSPQDRLVHKARDAMDWGPRRLGFRLFSQHSISQTENALNHNNQATKSLTINEHFHHHFNYNNNNHNHDDDEQIAFPRPDRNFHVNLTGSFSMDRFTESEPGELSGLVANFLADYTQEPPLIEEATIGRKEEVDPCTLPGSITVAEYCGQLENDSEPLYVWCKSLVDTNLIWRYADRNRKFTIFCPSNAAYISYYTEVA
eukprot:jgi/Psemu1/58505/gm1.58505_g